MKLAAFLRDSQKQRNENERDRAGGEQELIGYMVGTKQRTSHISAGLKSFRMKESRA